MLNRVLQRDASFDKDGGLLLMFPNPIKLSASLRVELELNNCLPFNPSFGCVNINDRDTLIRLVRGKCSPTDVPGGWLWVCFPAQWLAHSLLPCGNEATVRSTAAAFSFRLGWGLRARSPEDSRRRQNQGQGEEESEKATSFRNL